MNYLIQQIVTAQQQQKLPSISQRSIPTIKLQALQVELELSLRELLERTFAHVELISDT